MSFHQTPEKAIGASISAPHHEEVMGSNEFITQPPVLESEQRHALYSFNHISCPPWDIFQHFYILLILCGAQHWAFIQSGVECLEQQQNSGRNKRKKQRHSIKSVHRINIFVIWKLRTVLKILRILFWSVLAIVLPHMFAIAQYFFLDLLSYKYISFTNFLLFEKVMKVTESDESHWKWLAFS